MPPKMNSSFTKDKEVVEEADLFFLFEFKKITSKWIKWNQKLEETPKIKSLKKLVGTNLLRIRVFFLVSIMLDF